MRCRSDHVPTWVPPSALRYLAHTETGISIRALARDAGCHASTILRQIRSFETRREDPLVDDALRRLGRYIHFPGKAGSPMQEIPIMIKYPDTCAATALSEEQLKREAARALRRMCETGTILVVASSMEKAAILRERAGKEPTRVGVLDKLVAEAMALKGWIQCGKSGRVTRYVISRAGREALTHLLSDMEEPPQLPGFSEAASVFEGAEREVEPTLQSRRRRYGVAETPLTGLARRKDRDGKPFLPDDLIRAGERLREDFELAQMEPRSGQNWDMFLTAGVQAGEPSTGLPGPGSAARHRVTEALRDLGPGLGDVVLRCCCFLEGLERIEKRMGWSARSGKIVLRIALQRLKRHYDSLGDAGNLIG